MKMSRKLSKTLCLIALAVVFAGCHKNAVVSTGAYQYLYDWESRTIHPEYVVYHHASDSSTVFFRVFSSELLVTRSKSNAPFIMDLNVKATISDLSGVVSDTVSISFRESSKDRPGWLLGSVVVPMRDGEWNLLMEFTDISRNLTQPTFVFCDKKSTYSAQNYLLTKFETGEPVFGGFVSSGQRVQVVSARNASVESPTLSRINSDIKLPPPPFSANVPEQPSVVGAQLLLPKRQMDGSYVFDAEEGVYFFSHDTSKRLGLTVKTASSYFPKVKDLDALEWPIRFIMTKAEHEEIIKSNYSKALIDQFWLECAGSKEHARELIRIFYKRVEEANYYFSTYTEGWKTDRGMIHLLFGNPNQVIRSSDGEVWSYGEDSQTAILSFSFRKLDSPFTTNLFILEREPGYKPYWERMVQSWRAGKIYND
jgi:GWxTD domain-containing protein